MFTAPASALVPEGTLQLTVEDQTGYRTVTLTCGPTTGTHPDPAAACQALRQTDGNIEAMSKDQATTLCTLEYAPVTAAAQGFWRGRTVNFRKEFPNRCALHNETGPLFRF